MYTVDPVKVTLSGTSLDGEAIKQPDGTCLHMHVVGTRHAHTHTRIMHTQLYVLCTRMYVHVIVA